MQTLLKGFLRFKDEDYPQHEDRFRRLAFTGQRPRAVIVACCDSRVDPQMIFQANPGDLFVIRNVANLVPPYHPTADYHGTSAALEFAVRRLEVPNVIVMGHTGCGGIRAMLDGDQGSDFLGSWVEIAAPVRRKVVTEPDPAAAAEREGVRLSIGNLLTFPWVRSAVEAGRLALHGCVFDVASGNLFLLTDDRFDAVGQTPVFDERQ